MPPFTSATSRHLCGKQGRTKAANNVADDECRRIYAKLISAFGVERQIPCVTPGLFQPLG
eukprot:6736592-Lingulodinium_polyedra.AAC.1